MSVRKTVIDAIITGLQKSTSINYVTENLEPWWEWKSARFPGIIITDMETEINRLSYESNSTSVNDMEANLTLNFRGYVHHRANNRKVLNIQRTNLIADIEKTLKSSTNISDVTADVTISDIDTDRNMVENFSICEVNADILYFYHHLNP